MENIIEIKNLNKSFGEVKAVQDLSFCVKKMNYLRSLELTEQEKVQLYLFCAGSLKKTAEV